LSKYQFHGGIYGLLEGARIRRAEALGNEWPGFAGKESSWAHTLSGDGANGSHWVFHSS